MKNSINKQLMQRFVHFINTADEQLAEELIAPEAIFHVPGQAEPMHGPMGYLAIIAMMRSGFPDIQWTLEELIIEDNSAAARFTMNGTHQSAFFGVPASGNSISVPAANFYRFLNGKIIEEYGQPDMMGLLQQIGGIPQR